MTLAMPDETRRIGPRAVLRAACLGVLIALLAWTPFPLGSAVNWGSAVVALLVGAAWLLWCFSETDATGAIGAGLGRLWFAALPALLAFGWGLIQILPRRYSGFAHPVWQIAADGLGRSLPGTISLNPWHTEIELVKLASEALLFFLVFLLAQSARTARLLVDAVIAICALYALYAFVLAVIDVSQPELVYGLPFPRPYISGPFMLHNSFATFVGMAALAAMVRLIGLANADIVGDRGGRILAVTTLRFALGRQSLLLLATLLLLGALVASASRAGFGATAVAFLAVALVSLFLQDNSRAWLRSAALVLPLAGLGFILVAGGSTLAQRLAALADAGTEDFVRAALWDAAWRMIVSAPWTGLGLGSFEDAYPLYANHALAFVMDKAHSDYLEFAAGLGVPAAALWLAAMAGLAVLCLRGALVRRRNRVFPLIGFGACVLVAVHSSVDFSLQIPAVAVSFCVLLGVGAAQSFRTAKPGKPSGGAAN